MERLGKRKTANMGIRVGEGDPTRMERIGPVFLFCFFYLFVKLDCTCSWPATLRA